MKQTILTLALAIAMSFGIQAYAQSASEEAVKTEQCSKKDCPKKECKKDCKKEDCKKECKKADCKKAGKQCKKADKQCKKGPKQCRKAEGQRRRPSPAFRGIDLSEEQLAKITALNDKLDKDFEGAREKVKAECDKAREAYDQEVAKILTPEQVKIYEANKTEMKERRCMEPRVEGFAPRHKAGKGCIEKPQCKRDFKDCPKKAECKKAECKKAECEKAECPVKK